MITLKYFLTIILCAGVAGCGFFASQPAKPFVEPQLGMTKQQLTGTFGQPDSIEIYEKSNKTRVEFYTYVKYYQSQSGDNSVQQEKMPVCLINDRVVGWGKTYYEDHISADDIRLK